MSKVDNWQVGLVAAQNREFEKACELWLPLAENGNPMAQVNVAYLHMRGLIKDADLLIGEYWLSKAKERDQPEARSDALHSAPAAHAFGMVAQQALHAKRRLTGR